MRSVYVFNGYESKFSVISESLNTQLRKQKKKDTYIIIRYLLHIFNCMYALCLSGYVHMSAGANRDRKRAS